MSLYLILARDSRVLVDTGISLPGKGLFHISSPGKCLICCLFLARIVVPWQCAVVLLFTWMYVVMGRLGPTGCNSSIS